MKAYSMTLDGYRRFKNGIRLSLPKEVAGDVLAQFDAYRDLIFSIQSTARMIVETQTEMHPAHRELVQMIVDATEQVEFET